MAIFNCKLFNYQRVQCSNPLSSTYSIPIIWYNMYQRGQWSTIWHMIVLSHFVSCYIASTIMGYCIVALHHVDFATVIGRLSLSILVYHYCAMIVQHFINRNHRLCHIHSSKFLWVKTLVPCCLHSNSCSSQMFMPTWRRSYRWHDPCPNGFKHQQ